VRAGRIHAAEASLGFLAGLGADHPRTTTTGNVVLFPKVNVLVANREAFEELDEDDRALLRKAALVTAAQPDLAPDEKAAAEAFCEVGGRVVRAEASDVAALRAAMRTTRPPLEVARTRALAGKLADLVADLPEVEPVPTCGPQ
jgi:TRAP-type C4-dicarboxylate transport system substrate-binding protein